MLFVMLYAMFFFLIDGGAIVRTVLQFTPLSEEDKERLLQTFTSVGRATLKGTLTIGIVQGGLAGLAAGIVIGPLIGALSLTVWKLWGTAIDEAQRAEQA